MGQFHQFFLKVQSPTHHHAHFVQKLHTNLRAKRIETHAHGATTGPKVTVAAAAGGKTRRSSLCVFSQFYSRFWRICGDNSQTHWAPASLTSEHTRVSVCAGGIWPRTVICGAVFNAGGCGSRLNYNSALQGADMCEASAAPNAHIKRERTASVGKRACVCVREGGGRGRGGRCRIPTWGRQTALNLG